MAFIYRQNRVDTGDAIDPQDWLETQSAMVGEFNGNLDRDNLPENVITTEMIKNEQFNRIFYHRIEPKNKVEVGIDQTNWRAPFQTIEFDAPTDGVVIVHWGGTWNWALTSTLMSHGSQTHHALPFMAAWFRVKVNGIVVSNSIMNSWFRKYDSTYMTGVLPVVPGRVVVDIQARNVEHDFTNSPAQTRPSDTPYTITTSELLVQYKLM